MELPLMNPEPVHWFLVSLLLLVPLLLAVGLTAYGRGHRALNRNWIGVLFLSMCLAAGLGLILLRVAG